MWNVFYKPDDVQKEEKKHDVENKRIYTILHVNPVQKLEYAVPKHKRKNLWKHFIFCTNGSNIQKQKTVKPERWFIIT